jgi:hypothetical protein
MRKARGRARSAESAVFDPGHPPDIPGVVGLTRIGGGAGSTVYRGNERDMQRTVAVKILHTPVRDAQGRKSFEDECALAGQAGEHEYAAKLYWKGFAGDYPFIVMHYYTHGSLADRIRAGQHFTVGEVLSTGVHIASALQFAHDVGILHRDIKPANILCDGFGNQVLADFGIAAGRDMAARQFRYTMTPAFAAPEVLEHGGGWPQSDVWSLAATLYALLAGHPPFARSGGAGPGANREAFTGPLPMIGRTDVPGHMQETLARALIGRPDHRTASARRLAEELNADERALGLPPTPLRVGPGDPAPATVTAAGADVRPAADSLTETGPMDPRHRQVATAPGAQQGGLPAAGQQALGLSTETGTVHPGHSYRMPDAPPKPATRRGPAAALLAGGGAVVLVIAAIVVLALMRHAPVAGAPRAGASAGPVSHSTTPGASSPPAAAGRPAPPTHVRAVAVNGSTARIAWTDTAPRARYPVVISLGLGYAARVVPDRSPQVISGLSPSKPYCFAVGYVYTLQGKTVYSVPPVCIRGGAPAAGG